MTPQWNGIWVAFAACLWIGFGFFWVIRAERYLGFHWKPFFIALGILLMIISLWAHADLLSAIIGIAGGTVVWGAFELEDQAKRARLGWYPDHQPKIQPPWQR